MACKTITTEGGRVLAIVCSRGPISVGTCRFCSRRAAALCDAETDPGQTCGAKLCGQHAHGIFGLKGHAFCPPHYAEMKEVARV